MIYLQRVVLPTIIVALGVLCAGVMVFSAPKASKEAPPARVASVEVSVLQPVTELARVQASGEVVADQQVVLTPEVPGRVSRIASDLIPGTRFKAGAPLAWLDASDYNAALSAQETQLRQAQLELELEKGREATALKEWALLGDGRPAGEASLQLRKPHLALAEAKVRSAEAAVDKAKRDVNRTVLRAPFNALVVSESLDVGQVVGQGTQAVSLVGSDRVRIEVSLPVEELGSIQIPGWNGTQGSMVQVRQRAGSSVVTRAGAVIGLVGQLDPSTRTATVLIAVDDPLNTEITGVPLLPGTFVDVELIGKPYTDVYSVPRVALVDGGAVWTVVEGKLARQDVTVVWRGRDKVLVDQGLKPGSKVVTSPLALPVEGMDVRVGAKNQAASAAADAGKEG